MKTRKAKKKYRVVTIVTPDGERHRMFYNDDTNRMEVQENVILSRWTSYANYNWLNYRSGDLFCPEMKVKWLLDGCGNYLLEGNTAESGVLSRYKEMKIGNNEIPWSSCSEAILERTEVDDKKHAGQPRGGDELSYITSDKEHPEPSAHESKFQRMKTLFQNGSLSSCRVDTDGVFVHNGDRYKINGSVEVYQPKQTKIGLLYDADTIYCFTPKGSKTVYFYAQNLDFLSESVTKLTKNGGMDIGSARQ